MSAMEAMTAAGLEFRVIEHGPVSNLEEAAAARGVAIPDVVKTIVCRRGEDDYLFVLVPGDRVISWPKLRTLLGVSRLSMPDAATALAVTGYERGTITPFGSSRPWPVVADERLAGRLDDRMDDRMDDRVDDRVGNRVAGHVAGRVEDREITLGAGRHNTAVAVSAQAALTALGATVADISDPA